MKPKFKNRLNKSYKTNDGTIWGSRSVAVVGVIFFRVAEQILVLAQKRSQKMDAPGKFCVASGYLDWDESGKDGLIREVYEESGLYLPNIENRKYHLDNNPFYVKSEPDEHLQNVALNYSGFYDFEGGDWKLLELEKFKNDEIEFIKLIPLKEIDKYEWAFNHDTRIKMAVQHLVHGVFREYLDDAVKNYDSKDPIHILINNKPLYL